MLFTCRMDLNRILKTEKIPFQMFVFSLFVPDFRFEKLKYCLIFARNQDCGKRKAEQ